MLTGIHTTFEPLKACSAGHDVITSPTVYLFIFPHLTQSGRLWHTEGARLPCPWCASPDFKDAMQAQASFQQMMSAVPTAGTMDTPPSQGERWRCRRRIGSSRKLPVIQIRPVLLYCISLMYAERSAFVYWSLLERWLRQSCNKYFLSWFWWTACCPGAQVQYFIARRTAEMVYGNDGDECISLCRCDLRVVQLCGSVSPQNTSSR